MNLNFISIVLNCILIFLKSFSQNDNGINISCLFKDHKEIFIFIRFKKMEQ